MKREAVRRRENVGERDPGRERDGRCDISSRAALRPRVVYTGGISE